MTEADYADYIARFNANDSEGFGYYYCDDVVFDLGDKRQIVGVYDILDFHRDVKAKGRETLDILAVVTGPGHAGLPCPHGVLRLCGLAGFRRRATDEGRDAQHRKPRFLSLRDGKFVRLLGARYKTLPTVLASA